MLCLSKCVCKLIGGQGEGSSKQGSNELKFKGNPKCAHWNVLSINMYICNNQCLWDMDMVFYLYKLSRTCRMNNRMLICGGWSLDHIHLRVYVEKWSSDLIHLWVYVEEWSLDHNHLRVYVENWFSDHNHFRVNVENWSSDHNGLRVYVEN
jgi:hypothetical protein